MSKPVTVITSDRSFTVLNPSANVIWGDDEEVISIECEEDK
jgi:hypothetical protein